MRLHLVIALLVAAAALAVLSDALPNTTAAAEPVTLEVAAGDHDRLGVPVVVELPEGLGDAKHFTLTRLDDGKPVAVQRVPGTKPAVAWIVGERLAAGKVRRYRLAAADKPATAKGGVTVEDDGKHLLVQVAGKPVLRYNHAVVPSPIPKAPYYARSGYLHPVYNPSGQVVTDDFNPDHAHQHGIMMAWTKATFRGRPANCWDQKTGQGKVEHVKTEGTGAGPVFGHFAARLRHVSLNGPAGPEPMLDETWHVRVYSLSDYYLFDLESSQTCAGASPLVVEKYHYGGLMVRGHAAWIGAGAGDFVTSQGKTRRDGNHTRPRWCDIHGRLEGRPTGICVLGHPANLRFPQPVRLHPTMPYFCFTPATLGSFTQKPGGAALVSRYRFYVHDGPVDPKQADRLWHDLAEPPKIRVVTRP